MASPLRHTAPYLKAGKRKTQDLDFLAPALFFGLFYLIILYPV